VTTLALRSDASSVCAKSHPPVLTTTAVSCQIFVCNETLSHADSCRPLEQKSIQPTLTAQHRILYIDSFAFISNAVIDVPPTKQTPRPSSTSAELLSSNLPDSINWPTFILHVLEPSAQVFSQRPNLWPLHPSYYHACNDRC